jgi:hypothetical protein
VKFIVDEVGLELVFTSARLCLIPAHNSTFAPPPKVCNSSEQPANNHILGLQVASFITGSELGWLQSKEDFLCR